MIGWMMSFHAVSTSGKNTWPLHQSNQLCQNSALKTIGLPPCRTIHPPLLLLWLWIFPSTCMKDQLSGFIMHLWSMCVASAQRKYFGEKKNCEAQKGQKSKGMKPSGQLWEWTTSSSFISFGVFGKSVWSRIAGNQMDQWINLSHLAEIIASRKLHRVPQQVQLKSITLRWIWD